MLSPPQAGMTERQARFEALYAANHAPILGYALRRTASPDDAADILAETFLAAWRRLDELPPGDDARLWLYGVARRVLANYYRGERRRFALADRLRAELAGSYVPPEFAGESAEIAEALRRLPRQQRELLALNAWEGLDNGEIATVLGCSRNAVRIRLHRARIRLAAELAGTGDTEFRIHRTGGMRASSHPGTPSQPTVVGPAAQSPGGVPGTSVASTLAQARNPELSARPDQS
jgi:RNA polymerase sigma factor (sigma-70 family)